MSKYKIYWITALTFLVIVTFSQYKSDEAKKEEEKRKLLENLPQPIVGTLLEPIEETEYTEKILQKMR